MSNFLKTYFRLLAEDRVEGVVGKLLLPLVSAAGFLYGIAVRLHACFFEKGILKSKKLPYPVISVGNICWGGTGKTPLVEYLARKISEKQLTPLVLTRGYSHDEVEQMKHHLPRAVFGVGKDRYASAQLIHDKHKVHIAILDDGMQHRAIQRDEEIIVVNALNPFGNEKLLPRGILREPVSALKRATVVVMTNVNLIPRKDLDLLRARVHGLAERAHVIESYVEPLFLYRASRQKRVSIDKLQDQKVTTFSGIGTPRSFQLLLSNCRIKPARNFEFSDHHVYTEADLNEIKKVSQSASIEEIITTEKDFYRSPDAITKILNPLILATRLRISSGEEVLTERLSRLLGLSQK